MSHWATSTSFDSEEHSSILFTHSPPSRGYPTYYVQSPASREFSSEGDKSQVESARVESGLYSAASLAQYAMRQSARAHAIYDADYNLCKQGSRKTSDQSSHMGSSDAPNVPPGKKVYSKISAVSEEEIESEEGDGDCSDFRLYCLGLILCIFLLGIVILIIWLVCRPPSPDFIVKEVDFQQFDASPAADVTGVPTVVISTNCTLTIDITNPSRYFAIHAPPGETSLKFEGFTIASNQIQQVHVGKKSTASLSTSISVFKNPTYAAGTDLVDNERAAGGINLELTVKIDFIYTVIWHIMHYKFPRSSVCNMILDTSTKGNLRLLQEECNY
eukprot:c13920_g1_i2 orf=51-1040(+)